MNDSTKPQNDFQNPQSDQTSTPDQTSNFDQNSQSETDPLDSAMAHLSQYLKSATEQQQSLQIPPLKDWHPTQIGKIDIVIKANGDWWHEGRPIARKSLVRLFASVLWQEVIDGKITYFLKTPVQKLKIHVEDAPLLVNDVAVVMDKDVSFLEFSTTTGDVFRLDEEHPIGLRPFYPPSLAQKTLINDPDIRPYILVRDQLTALINRNTFYHLIDIGELVEVGEQSSLLLTSGGKNYRLVMPKLDKNFY